MFSCQGWIAGECYHKHAPLALYARKADVKLVRGVVESADCVPVYVSRGIYDVDLGLGAGEVSERHGRILVGDTDTCIVKNMLSVVLFCISLASARLSARKSVGHEKTD